MSSKAISLKPLRTKVAALPIALETAAGTSAHVAISRQQMPAQKDSKHAGQEMKGGCPPLHLFLESFQGLGAGSVPIHPLPDLNAKGPDKDQDRVFTWLPTTKDDSG